jgi:hypothetical protein
MKNFDKIINKASTQLLEDNQNPLINKAVEDIRNAITSSGKANSNPNAKALASKLFDTPQGTADDSLHSAFDKLKNNPENPNLSPKELETFLAVAAKLKPTETPVDKQEAKQGETPTTYQQSGTKTTQQTSQQPNGKQYNPLNQPSA